MMVVPRKLLTLAYVVRERTAAQGFGGGMHEVLLGKKIRGIGVGKWNGFGGKVESSDVSIAAAAARELQEEANVRVHERDLESRGVITWACEGGKETREVHVFLTSKFQGEPSVSDEMLPRWFSQDAIPYDNLWAEEDRLWLEQVLFHGKSVRGHYHLSADDTILEHTFVLE